MSALRKTYEMETGPAPVSASEYFTNCNLSFRDLLDKDPSEAEVQSFLEKHPCMVPGHPGATMLGAHPVWTLITQPVLPSYNHRKPDFMWISDHSFALIPTLIEIEKSNRKMFRQDGQPTAEFTHARNQLAQWREWFDNSANVQHFLDYYGIPERLRVLKREHYQTLVYGRRREFESNPDLNRSRGYQMSDGDTLMSFDRLEANRGMGQAITVRAKGNGRFEAVWVPEIFRLGPFDASRLLMIDGVADAIDENPNISDERKSFLRERIDYWSRWQQSTGGTGVIIEDDWE